MPPRPISNSISYDPYRAALAGGGRESDGFRGLFDGGAAEVPELDDARLLGVERREACQCFIEREHVDTRRFTDGETLVERDALRRAAALGGLPRPGALDE